MNLESRARALFFTARCVSALALTIAVGCGDDGATDSTGGAPGGAGGVGQGASGGGGGGGGGACPVGSHAGPEGPCEATLTGWVDGPPLAQRRDHHITFVVESEAGPFLYAAGGIEDNTTPFASSERAPILPDGSLGAWGEATPLPGTAGGAGVAVVGATLIVTGGFRFTESGQPFLSDDTDVTTIQPDGSLGAWAEGPKFGPTRFHHTMATHGDSIYVLGGLTGNNTDNTPSVERATVGADGTVGAWAEVTPLPAKRSHHSVAVRGAALFVTGGLAGDPAGSHTLYADVLRAPILEDGSLGAWSQVGELPAPLSTHASFVHADHLYVVGGIEGGHMNVARVQRAPIAADGAVGAWEELAPLPKARAHAHQTPLHAGHVYAVAGALNHNSIADVFIGRFE